MIRMLLFALALAILPVQVASARGGGRGGSGPGGGGGRGGRGGPGGGGARGAAVARALRNRYKDRKTMTRVFAERARAENLDAVVRDTRLDSR